MLPLVLNWWNHVGYLHCMWCNRRCTFLLRFFLSLLFILEVQGSNISPETGNPKLNFCDFPCFSRKCQDTTGGHSCLRPSPFPVAVHLKGTTVTSRHMYVLLPPLSTLITAHYFCSVWTELGMRWQILVKECYWKPVQLCSGWYLWNIQMDRQLWS